MGDSTSIVTAEINYIRPLPIYEIEKPFQILFDIPPDVPDQRMTNVEFETRNQSFADIRPRLADFTLDKNGFEICHESLTLTSAELADQQVIRDRYLPEVEKILRKHVQDGFDKVHFFDWRLRDSQLSTEPQVTDMNDLSIWLRPVTYVHIDHAPRAVVNRIRLFLGDEAERLLRGRVRVINVWRPVDHAVEDYPLAFCDASTLRDEDLVECDHVRRSYKGATLFPYHHPDQKFYFLRDQRPDEVTLLKIFDSDSDVPARACAHCSFSLDTEQPRKRKSFEVRALLFNYADETSNKEE
ncbi:methyltransferase CmcJ [Plectosphaerella cucumerina]|uniref:Methyltransferase CmcJ n=1 Tax=Plectosphaerella cucumerina TaxID=40658 RepID=A0A8K0TBF5_9PEZI|nr:methyltransferase CmcJ [Plectosphaerella cucumerina]